MNGPTIAMRNPAATRLIDELLRRELGIANPLDPEEMVVALRRRYAGDAARIDDEAAGLPLQFRPRAEPARRRDPAADTPGNREARRVQAHLESDLDDLVRAPANREWKPELTGWRATLVREYSDGLAAAAFAGDPAQRERGYLAVRRMNEFARLNRLIGLMNLEVNATYRRLARTLDRVASVMRVVMGEALDAAGLSEGGVLIGFPVSEARQYRDAVMLDLRRLTGTLAEVDENDWGNATASYRLLLETLDQQSAPELRVYLREQTLALLLDGLIDSVSRTDPESLRQLAATAPVEVARLRRLTAIAGQVGTDVNSPALSSFVQSLSMLLDAFAQTRSGARLIDLAVPLPLAADQADEADAEARTILRKLVGWRAEFAAEADCFMQCCGSGQLAELKTQVKIDKVLYDMDRAIDLYTHGEGRPGAWGEEEQRAAVFGIIADNLRNDPNVGAGMVELLDALRDEVGLEQALPADPTARAALIQRVVDDQVQMEIAWSSLVASLAPRCAKFS
jgi:hypothetical protein